jgi:hypothetical protein
MPAQFLACPQWGAAEYGAKNNSSLMNAGRVRSIIEGAEAID